MKEWLTIRREERWMMVTITAVILVFQYLIISKFWELFAAYNDHNWAVFMRNFHMSGFDPTAYSVLTDWHCGFDTVRHPLLAFMLWPVYGLNQLLWMLTGANCCQLCMGVILTVCGSYSYLFLFRIVQDVIGLSRPDAILVSTFFFGFAYILVAIIVPDHFCLSLALLLLTVYVSGMKLRRHERFTNREGLLLFTVTAGVTLSNGVAVFLCVLMVNGRRVIRWRPLLRMFVLPSVLLLTVALAVPYYTDASQPGISVPVSKQMAWLKNGVPRGEVIWENLFGESIQLHREHVLGDVLVKRPVIVRYTWKIQYGVEAVILLLTVMGVVVGREERFLWMVMAVFAFNALLHLILGFGLDEVYIMTAHWAFAIPVAVAYLLRESRPAGLWLLRAVLLVTTGYLWTYHSILLVHYLTWPLAL